MLTLHHLNESRSRRVLWLLEELAMPYELIKHQRDPVTQLSPESLKQVHPLAKAPVIVDGHLTLCESGAVLEYILDKAGDTPLKPAPGSQEYYHYLQWLHFAEGSLGLALISHLFLTMEQRSGEQPMDGYINKEVALDLDYIEATLVKQAYFAGNTFSAADIMMVFMLELAAKLNLLEPRPHCRNYLKNVQQRSAYQRALSHG
ncbi:glutathione S-transferase family protein [Motilimonas pumila]|uniref:glutathione transferase n=1 Tax=Motilimonas pumila TaxID=2303987 RepID=A0A418YDF2_9GAMM|nr:glutathione S-transferase family protein [Motilimonas pumila]RJG42569.1 glutathione S-transferase family protein [Motilimonas pumila]